MSSTTTVAPGFTAFTLSSIAFFSSGVKLSGFATTVLSDGVLMSFPAFGNFAASAVFVNADAGITAVFLPSAVVTVAFPLSSTTTVAPGFTAFTLSSIAFFSSGVKLSGFATTVLSDGVLMSFPAFGLAAASAVFVKSSPGITSVLPSFVETVVLPLSSTVTTASGFTSFTFATIAAFSSGVSEAGFFTNVLSAGLTTLFPAFGTVIKSSFFTT